MKKTLTLGLLFFTCSCFAVPAMAAPEEEDVHSHSQPQLVRTTELDMALKVDFKARLVTGEVTYTLERKDPGAPLVLDSRELKIEKAVLLEGAKEIPATFTLSPSEPLVGSALTIPLTPKTQKVKVVFRSTPESAGLQWADGAQTASGHPFFFTLSEAIHGRSWLPCQDTPRVRVKYRATVQVPDGNLALMSAENPQKAIPGGLYHFKMDKPIPSYLIALAVGKMDFLPLGKRSGVYAEPSIVKNAAFDFADTEKLLAAAERLFGPYLWGRYDILVLPFSFPYGGMENPRITFVSPTLVTGDRSMVSVIAHEIGHSWAGNLVTNANWNHFWLNEGFTVYVEKRIIEEVFGKETSIREQINARTDLVRTIKQFLKSNPAMTSLRLHLSKTDDPDDTVSPVAYQKGATFLQALEELLGRARLDAYLRQYFKKFSFQSITTETFLLDLKSYFKDVAFEKSLDLKEWIEGRGLPTSLPRLHSSRFNAVTKKTQEWLNKTLSVEALKPLDVLDQLLFLDLLSKEGRLSSEQLTDLERTFSFSRAKHAGVFSKWSILTIRDSYYSTKSSIKPFLLKTGRMLYIVPVYQALMASSDPVYPKLAREIYAEARKTYHAVTRARLDSIVK